MKVKELIAALQKFDQELEVYGCCDHGQTPEKVSPPSEIYVKGDSYSIWDSEWTSDEESAEEMGYKVKAVLL
jgi:hypothetical protein